MNLKQKLEKHYNAFDKSNIEPDPLQFLHLFDEPKDIESIGLIASIFSYGNMVQIINSLNRIKELVGNSPFQFIMNFNPKSDAHKFEDLRHRFYTTIDIIHLFDLLKSAYQNFSSLNNLFLFKFNFNDENVKAGISSFSHFFLENYKHQFGSVSQGFRFMFPLPEKGSACKRMNLFLRWMVRKDELDFGLWNGILPRQLIIPVDTHIAQICLKLRLTNKKNVSWQMAEEITSNLKKFDKQDPVKYDFALCHIGMRRLEF